MTVKAPFRQADIDRAVRAVSRAGWRPRVTMRGGEVIVEALDGTTETVRDEEEAHLETLLDRHAS